MAEHQIPEIKVQNSTIAPACWYQCDGFCKAQIPLRRYTLSTKTNENLSRLMVGSILAVLEIPAGWNDCDRVEAALRREGLWLRSVAHRRYEDEPGQFVIPVELAGESVSLIEEDRSIWAIGVRRLKSFYPLSGASNRP